MLLRTPSELKRSYEEERKDVRSLSASWSGQIMVSGLVNFSYLYLSREELLVHTTCEGEKTLQALTTAHYDGPKVDRFAGQLRLVYKAVSHDWTDRLR